MNSTSTTFRPCPVCDSHAGYVLGRLCYALFDDLDIPGEKTLTACRQCGMMYDDVAFTDDQLSGYYRMNEHYAFSGKGGTGSSSSDNNDRYDRIIDQLKPDGKDLILDYGCGQGGFLSRCRQRGLQAAGIEMSVRSREVAAASGLEVYESPEAFARINNRRIGAVVFSHVLEHLLHPLHGLQSVARLAPAGAVFYFEVPDADAYLAGQSIHWEEMYFEHLNHFRHQSLYRLAARLPLSVIREERIEFSRDLKDVKCLMLTGQLSEPDAQEKAAETSGNFMPSAFSSLSPAPDLPDGPLAIWGMSQYAMLLLGSLPGLKERTVRLFDSSPAKKGRTIRNLPVESPDRLASLGNDITLLIPRSAYLASMLKDLKSKSFKGAIKIV